MDYNYIRMRNAAKVGDEALRDHYRKLYESGKDIKATSHIIDYVLVLLIIIAIVLGIYAMHLKQSVKTVPQAPAVTETVPEAAENTETENSEV